MLDNAVCRETWVENDSEGEGLPVDFVGLREAPVAPTLDQIRRLEAAIPLALETYDIDSLTRHHFCEGMYVRELTIPAGGVIVGKMHAKENVFLLAKGDMTVWTEQGVRRVQAPFLVVTKPGDKRVGYAHEESITMNFHANHDDERDLEVLESRYILPEALPAPAEMEKLT